ncbi:methyltransferase domain-containing protein [Streptomyces cremeus]|uniref:Protein-L-isoaspartate O-methyltransferase n=1 Tax=Streptomyces cremeus TaxID=66881 RepID=A0ABV5P9S6_STRCM
MVTVTEGSERDAMRGLLRSMSEGLGASPAPAWENAYWAVPRHRFLPDRIWVGDAWGQCSRETDPETWLRHAYADTPVITQVNDGQVADPEDRWPSCSASAPSIVFRMLHLLDVSPGQRVLEIGTGTGWNAGLLAHRLGPERVTTLEVDQALADRAVRDLAAVGLRPHAVCVDGESGYEADGPYDRVIATCSVRSVPPAWIAQTKPGGVILLPWESPWLCYGLLRLTVDGYGAASGPFFPYSAFMLMRGQRRDLRIFRDVVRDDHVPAESRSGLAPWTVAGDDWAARFAIGLQLRRVWRAWHEDPGVAGVARRLWVATTDAASWAAVDWDGRNDERFTVWQHGSRPLWDLVEAAHAWWRGAGSPGPERFGLTVTADGSHRVWLDAPGRPVPRLD